MVLGFRLHRSAVRHDSCRTDKGILLVRDISEQREEEQRRRISEQYDHALRNIYDELYELNITQDSYRIVYHVKGKYVTPPEQGRPQRVHRSRIAQHALS